MGKAWLHQLEASVTLDLWSIGQYRRGSGFNLGILTPTGPFPPMWLHSPWSSDVVSLDGEQTLKPQEHRGTFPIKAPFPEDVCVALGCHLSPT